MDRDPAPAVRRRGPAAAEPVRAAGGGGHRERAAVRGGAPPGGGAAALLDTMRDLSGELELSRVLQGVLERAVALLGVTGGELATHDAERHDLVIVASHHMGTNAVGTRMALGEGAMGRVAETKEPLIIPRYQEWLGRSAQYQQDTVQSVMVAPLLIGTRLVGTIASVHSDPTRIFGAEDLRLLEIVRAAGGDRHRERAPLHGVAPAAAVLRGAGAQQPGGDRDPRHRAPRGLLQSRVRADVRLRGGRGAGAEHRRPHHDRRDARAGRGVHPAGAGGAAGRGDRASGAGRTARWWTWRCWACRWWWTASAWGRWRSTTTSPSCSAPGARRRRRTAPRASSSRR